MTCLHFNKLRPRLLTWSDAHWQCCSMTTKLGKNQRIIAIRDACLFRRRPLWKASITWLRSERLTQCWCNASNLSLQESLSGLLQVSAEILSMWCMQLWRHKSGNDKRWIDLLDPRALFAQSRSMKKRTFCVEKRGYDNSLNNCNSLYVAIQPLINIIACIFRFWPNLVRLVTFVRIIMWFFLFRWRTVNNV